MESGGQKYISDSFRVRKIAFFDDGGVLRLAVRCPDLLCIESADNYIRVRYTGGKGELKTYMLRCRLKSVADRYAGCGLVRCHRRFIVNVARISRFRKERGGYVLDLDDDRLPAIPVSETYADYFFRFFRDSRMR